MKFGPTREVFATSHITAAEKPQEARDGKKTTATLNVSKCGWSLYKLVTAILVTGRGGAKGCPVAVPRRNPTDHPNTGWGRFSQWSMWQYKSNLVFSWHEALCETKMWLPKELIWSLGCINSSLVFRMSDKKPTVLYVWWPEDPRNVMWFVLDPTLYNTGKLEGFEERLGWQRNQTPHHVKNNCYLWECFT